MAQLSSPGVSVTVIDESFYTPAAPGTVPLIFVASAENKQNGADTGTADGTTKSKAGKVYLLTSQKELADTFGTPTFKTDANNNPVHAGEQNEYGLQAAYSYLGVSNRAYVVRADVDLNQLDATADAPTGAPANGTYWLNTANSRYGVFQWNSAQLGVGTGQTSTNVLPTVITDRSKVVDFAGEDYTPLASFGAVGDYALVAVSTLNKLWFKKPVTSTGISWVEVGSTQWTESWPTVQGSTAGTLTGQGTLTISGTPFTGYTNLDTLVEDINDLLSSGGRTAANINGKLALYSEGANIVITGAGAILTELGITTGTYLAPKLQISTHVEVPTFKRSENPTTVNGAPTGSLWIKTTTPNLGASWIVKKYNAVTATWVDQPVNLYADNANALKGLDTTGGGINLAAGTIYVKTNDDEGTPPLANFKIYARKAAGQTVVTSSIIGLGTFAAGAREFTVSWSRPGLAVYTTPVTVGFTSAGTANDANTLVIALKTAIANSTNITAELDSSNRIVITHLQGGDIKFVDTSAKEVMETIFSTGVNTNFYDDPTGASKRYVASLWTPSFSYEASASAPTDAPVDGQLWYSSITDQIDIMIHDGDTWVGYQNVNQSTQAGDDATDPLGPIVSATKPKLQSDGSPLATGDLWIDTSDLENYPALYRYQYQTKKWVAVDTGDQTTGDGILFRDARWNVDGIAEDPSSIVELLDSDFLDFDAPDPALYPRGMLLWNLRRSGFNVKRYVAGYVDTLANNPRYEQGGPIGEGDPMENYYPDRWVSEAANQANGAGTFGRKAQRAVVVQKLQALVNANQEVRDEESRIFNLIACPGYPELIGELISLNYDRGLTAFVVGDTPARLAPDATTLNNWGQNLAGALEDNDSGLVSFDEYLGVFYPWGFTSDNIGNNIVVPPSHMMLRTIALSDNVSYPWFAPAGTRRGGITNATSVGHVNAEGEFQSVALNNGQRDTLAGVKVNPITFITGTGLVNYGQYTRAKNASALDRINVARLVIYLRRQFAQLAKPYVFEPNDKITRDEIKGAAESLLLELVGQRALYDYIVVCDTSNNTPARIDRSELYLDVAIEPVKAVEFIYIPLRLKNTGEIAGL